MRRPIALAAFLLLATALPSAVPAARTLDAPPQSKAAQEEEEAAVRLFRETFRAVRANYVDPVPAQELTEAAMRAMVQRDKWSTYLSTGQYEETRLKRDGAMIGLGLNYTRSDAGLTVTNVVASSPAAAAGIQPGDLITAIDGTPAGGMEAAAATAALKGPRGSTVVLQVERVRGGQAMNMTVARDLLTLPSVEVKTIEDVGYVRIARFDRQTAPGVAGAVERLQRDVPGMRGLVLDLRGNPGGLVKAAVETADMFLDAGVILRQEDRGRAGQKVDRARTGDLLAGRPLVVLIDAKSASAAEILAGALRDNHRATLVGEKTYGKGVIQSFLPVESGGAIKLTTARYLTPDNRPVDQVGITPHHQVSTPEPVTTGTDPQLNYALSLLRGA